MKVSVIIPVCNEEDSLLPVLKEAQKIKPLEIIVVVNGSSDATKAIAEGAGCRVIYYEEALGINIGRAIGAKKAKGDILLFWTEI